MSNKVKLNRVAIHIDSILGSSINDKFSFPVLLVLLYSTIAYAIIYACLITGSPLLSNSSTIGNVLMSSIVGGIWALWYCGITYINVSKFVDKRLMDLLLGALTLNVVLAIMAVLFSVTPGKLVSTFIFTFSGAIATIVYFNLSLALIEEAGE